MRRTDKETEMNPKHTSQNPFLVGGFWLYVGIPLAWGVWSTLQKALALFH
jgi:hypothetical protein